MERKENSATPRMKWWIQALVVCSLGVLINFAGVHIAAALGLPLYLDNIGIILASAVGGTMPGILVGFFSNVINGLSDPVTIYYGFVSVINAVIVSVFYRKGLLKKLHGCIFLVLCMAIVGGGIGSYLTWMLYGGGFGEGISSNLTLKIYYATGWTPFFSQFAADIVLDILDKTITVVVALGLLKLIPENIKSIFYVEGWRQAPLTAEEKQVANKGSRSVHSLRVRITGLLSAIVVLIAVVVAAVSYILFHQSTIEEQGKLAEGVANVVAASIDPEMVDEYLEKGEKAEGYNDIMKRLDDLIKSTPDIDFVYVYRILEDGCHVVFDPDTEDLPGMNAGDVVAFDEDFAPYLDDLLAGREIAPVISDGQYGWLLTAYVPVYDSQGVCQCYAAADINMKMLKSYEMIFVTKVFVLFGAFFVLILAVGVWLAEYHLILPINTMSMAADAFAYDSDDSMVANTEKLKTLDIHTEDELEHLYLAIIKTSEDTVRFMDEMEKKNAQISRLQNGLILVLADLVESRDACTGNHVRNTALYAKIIMEQMRKEGIYEDQLTDDFIFDVYNMAPLHDVGKITVPDALLNKPGRLTPEEFEIMKGHAAAGGAIINQAIEAVSETDTGYLKEAKNLATYHHEKWNGTGYPYGLVGENIPLSARIMAVADVFDALVSRRSYKEGFPFEKAMSIIEEGMGSHFDPNVAGAFLRAADQVSAVLEEERLAEQQKEAAKKNQEQA
ncbi:MAG: HD domain-containing protein [Blautia sp.]|nr:HD domain-containing protein [Blautia sp.]